LAQSPLLRTSTLPRPLIRTPSHPGINIERRLPHEAASVDKARHALRPLANAFDPNTFETLRLLVSELVTNSVRHGTGEGSEDLELSVWATRERIRVEVSDDGAGFAPVPRAGNADQESGWGLHLVEALSDRWGTDRNGWMHVWFELIDSGAFAHPPRPDALIRTPQ